MADKLQEREKQLQERLMKISEMEEEIRRKEKAIKEKEKAKKQVPLRLSPSLYDELAAWAEEVFRSVNSHIEYVLAECVRKRKKK